MRGHLLKKASKIIHFSSKMVLKNMIHKFELSDFETCNIVSPFSMHIPGVLTYNFPAEMLLCTI